MTIINTFGINAGREIAREIDDESDKSRRDAKRRANATYLADKERLHARFRQMNEHAAQVSADRFTALMQEQRADTKSHVSSQRSSIPSHEENDPTLKPAQSQPSADDSFAVIPEFSGRQVQATRENSRRPLDQVAGPRSAIASRNFANQTEIDAGAVMELGDSDDREKIVGAPGLLDRLLAEINSSPSSLTREGVTSALEHLSQDLYARSSREVMRNETEGVLSHLNLRSPREVTAKEKEGVLGYIEFLKGYFEKGETSAGPSQQIAALMESIRVQLSAVSDPLRVTDIQSLAVASQLDNQLPVQVVNREQRKNQLKSTAFSEEEAQCSDLDVYASTAMMNSVDAALSVSSKKESSQSKDSQRRREETLVSVTLRSV
jgi:hypothetical protein